MKLAVPLLLALVSCSEPKHPSNCGPKDHSCHVSEALDAVDVKSCRNHEGPYGKGHIRMLVSPKGEVTEAMIDGGPFAGTHEGECVINKYKAFKAPSYDDPLNVSVGKSFEIH